MRDIISDFHALFSLKSLFPQFEKILVMIIMGSPCRRGSVSHVDYMEDYGNVKFN